MPNAHAHKIHQNSKVSCKTRLLSVPVSELCPRQLLDMAAKTSLVSRFDDIVASTNILVAGTEGSEFLLRSCAVLTIQSWDTALSCH